MICDTIVENNDKGLEMVLAAAKLFCEGRYLYAVKACNLSFDELRRLTDYIREKDMRFHMEYNALVRFSLTWPDSYATDNNKCFELAKRMLNKIRSTASGAKILYKTFYKTTRKKIPNVESRSVFKFSEISQSNYINDLFGKDSYDECVAELYDLLESFYERLISALALCRYMIMYEALKRNSPEIEDIYTKQLNAVAKDAMEIIGLYNGIGAEVPMDEMSKKMIETGNRLKVLRDYYHKKNRKEFKQHIAFQLQERSKKTGITPDEQILWPDNIEQVCVYRSVASHFDEIYPKSKDGKLNSEELAAFMFWTGIKPNEKKTTKFNIWLKDNYKGQYTVPSPSMLNKAKNHISYFNKDNRYLNREAFDNRLEELAQKYNNNPKNLYDETSINYNLN